MLTGYSDSGITNLSCVHRTISEEWWAYLSSKSFSWRSGQAIQWGGDMNQIRATLWVLGREKCTVLGKKKRYWGQECPQASSNEVSGCCWRMLTSDLKVNLRRITWRLGNSVKKRWADEQNVSLLNSFINCGVKNELERKAAGSKANTW